MRTRIALAAVVACLAATAAPPMAARAAGPVPSPPPAENLVVDLVTMNGSGCSAGTVAVEVAPDNTAIVVTYRQYRARAGVGAAPTDFRKNCQLLLAIHLPAGFTAAIPRVDYHGHASLAQGATGMLRAAHYRAGGPASFMVTHPFPGPMDGDWQATQDIWIEPVYLPCGSTSSLNLNTELRVSVGTSDPATTTSVMAMDSTDGSSPSRYDLVWATC